MVTASATDGSRWLWMEKIMRKTTDMAELSLGELNLISGGDMAAGNTGSIEFSIGTGGAGVTWPGAVDGVSGTWHMSSKNGLSWKPA
jgi:hypothetical protein